MDRAEYLASYCASIDCTNKKLGDCDLCMYEKGRADVIKEVMSYLHEYDIIDCDCCPENNRCDRDCWDVIAEQLKEHKNE